MKVSTDKEKIQELLTRGVEEILIADHLRDQLLAGKKLRVKFGIDPTSPDIHLGHTVPLRKLRQFQDLGHTAVLIIGDFTAMIGDPSGRNEERKPLTKDDVKKNMKTYLKQAGKILNLKQAEVVYNSSWFPKAGLAEVMSLSRAGSIQQTLQRADFKKRLEEGNDVSMTEALYPLLQGYDSVKVRADVELGGRDQKLNLLMGRRVQRHFGLPEQDIMIFPLLLGLDGVKKMSKSVGNYIGVNEEPHMMFGKVMSIPDSLVNNYFELLTNADRVSDDPREAKLELARHIVDSFYGEKKANDAKQEFIRVFSQKKAPSEIETVRVREKISLVELLVVTKFASSKSEARRLIEQGGVSLDDEKKSDPNEIIVPHGQTLRVGKHRFIKIIS